MKAATAVRDKEHADFLVEKQDHQESVEQMGKATNTVGAAAHDTAQKVRRALRPGLPRVNGGGAVAAQGDKTKDGKL